MKWSGICINGPLRGREIPCDGPVFYAMAQSNRDCYMRMAPVSRDELLRPVDLRKVTYRRVWWNEYEHTVGLGRDDEPVYVFGNKWIRAWMSDPPELETP